MLKQRTISNEVEQEELLGLIDSMPTPRRQLLKKWLTDIAQQHMQESEDPELALLRARKLYRRRGYSDRWINKRLRGVSARHELTSEWAHRGIEQNDDYRRLTNELIQSAFGLDVEHYRNYKRLSDPSEHLRDHMSDLELALVTLAETTAAELHRRRESTGTAELESDVKDAGQIVAGTVSQIEKALGRSVVQSRGSD